MLICVSCRVEFTSDGGLGADEQFGDLHRVRRRAFAEVVADAPERQAVVAREVFADAADEDGVVAVAVARLGVLAVRQVVDDFDAGEVGEQLAGFFDRNLALGFDEDAFAVAIRNRHANAGGADAGSVSSPRILCVSYTIFISSEV